MGAYGMKPITRTCLILVGLVVVHVALHVYVWGMEPGDLDLFKQGVASAIPTQGVLLGFWIAMGARWAIPWRARLGFAIAATATFAQDRLATYPDPFLASVLKWEMCLVALALVVLRVAGLRMIYADVPATTSRPFQFSLLETLSWMTATAVFLASLKCYAMYYERYSHSSFDVLIIACSVVPALTAIWLVFGRRWLSDVVQCLGCMMAVVMASSFAGVAVIGTAAVGVRIASEIAFLFSVYAVWLIASFLVIRWAGYGLEWR